MITLNIDIDTNKPPFDLENIEDSISIIDFDKFLDLEIYLMCELNAGDEKVYILAYGGDEDGIVFVDHITGNILHNVSSQLKDIYEGRVEPFDMNVFLFAEDNYNEAYRLAIDMKEQTGMLDFQLEQEDEKEDPTIGNGGVISTSSIN